ncbi:MAG: Asp-tRNA(Asn)/Glu-tRNA(Gln) amidotransferase subunit GatB [Candidatus Omnitrophica bacterium]|nr:Asp-tRNA(Asn)/Glu-tRNA(Gln) amidotransferase subunit GatB [Candidatus Omnitrophota bacterium]
MSDIYETVIGLEVHVQLSTRTKAFCGCSTAFGAEANTQVCPVCLGLPGVLPVYNKKAFEYALKVAMALECDIQKTVKFDRKNYYYPDLPKNYQISQYDMPLAYNGKITIEDEEEGSIDIGITRAHLEEDAGKLMHDEQQAFSYVDLNRTGTPLLEIVSEPDIRSPEQAYEYLKALKQTIKYLDVSDCNMEEGSLRCDANVSLRRKGSEKFGSKVEIKNLNSFKAVRDALVFEQLRQEEALEEQEKVIQQTRLWNEQKNVTEPMRTKEEAQDYRYFPDPDLVPFEVAPEVLERVRQSMPELPRRRKERFVNQYRLSEKDVEVLTSEKPLADFYEAVVSEYNDPQAVCNWVKGEIMMHIKDRPKGIEDLGLKPGHLASIIEMSKKGKISGLAAKEVLRENLDSGKDPEMIVKEKGLEQVSDKGELESIVVKVIEQNEKSVNDYRGGKENALSYLVGQVMRQTKGKANPKLAGEMLRKKITG